jgi:hypothetical protein
VHNICCSIRLAICRHSLFEHICQEVGETMSLGGVLLVRDFNARIGTNTDFIDCSQLTNVLLVP